MPYICDAHGAFDKPKEPAVRVKMLRQDGEPLFVADLPESVVRQLIERLGQDAR